MALSLGVKAGSRIKIGEHVLQVLKVEDEVRITIQMNDRQYVITDVERQLIAPEVYVSCGSQKGKGLPDYGRLAIEAPRRIPINRLDSGRSVRDFSGSGGVRTEARRSA